MKWTKNTSPSSLYILFDKIYRIFIQVLNFLWKIWYLNIFRFKKNLPEEKLIYFATDTQKSISLFPLVWIIVLNCEMRTVLIILFEMWTSLMWLVKSMCGRYVAVKYLVLRIYLVFRASTLFFKHFNFYNWLWIYWIYS